MWWQVVELVVGAGALDSTGDVRVGAVWVRKGKYGAVVVVQANVAEVELFGKLGEAASEVVTGVGSHCRGALEAKGGSAQTRVQGDAVSIPPGLAPPGALGLEDGASQLCSGLGGSSRRGVAHW